GDRYGTPGYIAPEQALGMSVDPRADVYALGCVAYRLATGVTPFRAPSLKAKIHAMLFDDPLPACSVNPNLPEGVHTALSRALAKDRSIRTPSARRFATEFRNAFGTTSDGLRSSAAA